MTAEPNLWLKLKSKQLIKRCGGLAEASKACAESCRPYSVPQLGRCQNPGAPDYLPIDIVLCLEAYCGEPVVTQAMAEARPAASDATDLRDEASDVTERSAALQRRVREALADDGMVDAREAIEIGAAIEEVIRELGETRAALRHAVGPKTRGIG